MSQVLNEREKTILRSIIFAFIRTAQPVGSRYISKRQGLRLSPATVRNVMSDLEYLGYIDHPHTSAGRIPTDKGYRFYVDSLMELERLSEREQSEIHSSLEANPDPEEMLKATSKLLGSISHQLGVVSTPRIADGLFERLELVSLSSSRIMVIISVKSGLVKTIMLEVTTEIPREKLDQIARMLNERLSGLTLHQIRVTFAGRVQDMRTEETGLVRIFIDSVDKLFADQRTMEKVHVVGAQSLLNQPEFVNAENFRSVIELLENEDVIVHVLENIERKKDSPTVSIGQENNDEKLRDFSLVTSEYVIGEAKGSVGIIGNKRMDYPKMIPLVDYVAKTISSILNE